jgi:hypothetical protein
MCLPVYVFLKRKSSFLIFYSSSITLPLHTIYSYIYMNISKKKYIQGFCFCVIILAIIKCIVPNIDTNKLKKPSPIATPIDSTPHDSIKEQSEITPTHITHNIFFNADGTVIKHRIFSVPSFQDAFPDQNDVQLVAASKNGVNPVENGNEAERRKSELVYVGSNPYFYVQPLRNSIPYLIPRASVLLQDIGRNFYDSLTIKGIPLHKIIVTSIMRSKDDVDKLVGHNRNAKINSCHLYGTTFDVAYNRYKTVEDPNGPKRRLVRDDTLKWILSEVLNKMRNNGRCYIKYEVHQGCFHITTR